MGRDKWIVIEVDPPASVSLASKQYINDIRRVLHLTPLFQYGNTLSPMHRGMLIGVDKWLRERAVGTTASRSSPYSDPYLTYH
jgi:hypothetical protein